MITKARAGLETGVKTSLEFGTGLEEPKVVKLSILRALLPYTIALLEANSLSGLLKAIKLCKRLFVQVVILK